MVVRFCHQIHNKQPQCCSKELLLKIIGRVVETYSAIIFACRKKCRQAKGYENQYQCHKNRICLSGLFQFCLHNSGLQSGLLFQHMYLFLLLLQLSDIFLEHITTLLIIIKLSPACAGR